MAATLFTLLDDVASLLDDVSAMTKVAAKKTAGVLGDDLALNVEQVTGVNADRELPVVWAVFKGSLKNKLILVPLALLISALAPWLVTPLLIVGGGYLCFEGFEKVAHGLLHQNEKTGDEGANGHHQHAEIPMPLTEPGEGLEAEKIRGAVRTDFVLSAEIITIALGTVAEQPLIERCLVVVAIAIGMTIGVYGLVAGIVKLDDLGLHLERRSAKGMLARVQRGLGRSILTMAPLLMKFLSTAGTAAMFLVGGGILVHGVPVLAEQVGRLGELGGLVGKLAPLGANFALGIAFGAAILGALRLVQMARRSLAPA